MIMMVVSSVVQYLTDKGEHNIVFLTHHTSHINTTSPSPPAHAHTRTHSMHAHTHTHTMESGYRGLVVLAIQLHCPFGNESRRYV